MEHQWIKGRMPAFFVVLVLLAGAITLGLAYHLGIRRTAESLPVAQIASRIDEAVFSNRQSGLAALTRSEAIREVVLGREPRDNPKVAVVLETARRIFDADIVYVMDREGTVVSCTPYEGGKTLTGNAYAFRPYFRTALAGEDTVYPGVGVTTGLRGLYFSTPIRDEGKGVLGAMVVKVGLDSIDAILASHAHPVFLVSPDGVVFASNRKEALFHYVRPLSPEALAAIHASKQFGGTGLRPFPVFFEERPTVEYRDERWTVSRRAILSNWTVFSLIKGGPTFAIDKPVAFLVLGVLALLMGVVIVLLGILRERARVEASLRESERRLREAGEIQSLILDNSFVGITFVKHRVFEWSNGNLSGILGLTPEQVQGAPVRIVYASQEEYERVGRSAYLAMASGERFEDEILAQRADGNPFWARILGKALDPERPDEGSIWIFEDISARKRTEEELKAYREHLEDLVDQRTSELREAKEQAEAATQAKSVFLASMSHELRTPLNAILGYAQLLSRTAQEPEAKDNLARIHRAGEHLLGLINHVLSLSRIEAGKLTLDNQPFPTEPFFKALEDMTRIRAQAKGLAFRLEVPSAFPRVLVGDALKLRQVLMNLVGNAIKFTAHGSVELRVDRTGDRVRFRVQDTGEGLSAEEVSKLFQAFHQAQAGRQAAEGSGLGLHISQAMVQLMGGTITVESAPGQGSLFAFEVPLPEGDLAPGDAALRQRELEPGQPSLRMLVVDDVEDNRTLLARMLTGFGMEVQEAPDGPSALTSWEAWRPRVVWMDLRMPGMDGYEAVARLRAREAELGRPRCIVIALTASVLDLEMASLRDQGFDDLVPKPFPESELLVKLHRHCGLAFREEAPRSAEVPEGQVVAELARLEPAWLDAFEGALQLGDREEAQRLLGDLPRQELAGALAASLKAFQFDRLRDLVNRGRSHA